MEENKIVHKPLLFRISNFLLLICLLLFIGGAFSASRLEVFHDLETFFPVTDDDLDYYEEHRAQFNSDDNFIYIAIVREDQKSIYDSLFLSQVAALTDELKGLEQVSTCVSLCNMPQLLYTPFGMNTYPTLHYSEPNRYKGDSIKITNDPRLVNRFISEDASTFVLCAFHQEDLTEDQLQDLVLNVDAKIAAYSFAEVHVGGRPHTVSTIVNAIGSEFAWYALMSSILTLIVMTFLLQRFWGVVITVVAVLFGLVVFMGFLGLLKVPLDIMSPLFPTLMIVVGMSDIIHLLTKYLDEIKAGANKEKALKTTLKEIGMATFLTSVTTAVGFASLYLANIIAIKRFGLWAAIGVLVAYLSVMLFSAAALHRFEPNQLANLNRLGTAWTNWLEKWYDWVRTNRKKIAIFGSILFFVSLYGISRISTNIYMLGDIPETDKLRSDFVFFEKKLSGIRTFEMGVSPQEGYKVNDLEVLNEVKKLEDYINTIPEVGTIYSPVTVYAGMNQAFNASKSEYFKLPEKQKQITKYDRELKKIDGGGFNSLMNSEYSYGRISGNMADVGSEKVEQINSGINQWITKNVDPEIVQFRLTGSALLVDKNHVYLRQSLFSGLGLAFLVVSLIMALLFKDWKMVLISLIPNVFPLLITGAIMGFFGISLKASTSIIFTIAFGIAVDDTIHFLSKFKWERMNGAGVEEAVKTTFLETGKALCLTTVILFFGFMLLIGSAFKATFYIGLLISLTLVSALLADLFLLPVCIHYFIKSKEERRSKNY